MPWAKRSGVIWPPPCRWHPCAGGSYIPLSTVPAGEQPHRADAEQSQREGLWGCNTQPCIRGSEASWQCRRHPQRFKRSRRKVSAFLRWRIRLKDIQFFISEVSRVSGMQDELNAGDVVQRIDKGELGGTDCRIGRDEVRRVINEEDKGEGGRDRIENRVDDRKITRLGRDNTQ